MTPLAPIFRSYRLKSTYHVTALAPVLSGIALTFVAIRMSANSSHLSESRSPCCLVVAFD
jgi:hypothetical protein